MSYEKALRNLVVFMFRHYIDAFKSTGAWQGHQAILALECFSIADQLGRFHWWYKQADLTKPRILKTRWMDLPSEPQDDSRPYYASSLAVLGSPKQPSYGHLKILGWYFDHVYHQGRYIRQLTQKSWDKSTSHNQEVYDRELNETISYI